MTKKGREFNEIYDLTAMRVIVDSVKDCYGAVGVIHSLWKPLPGRFKDMIAMPKFNMYQALHTTVIGPEGRPLEIQIRTRDMHETAEYGVAAHWTYKEGKAQARQAARTPPTSSSSGSSRCSTGSRTSTTPPSSPTPCAASWSRTRSTSSRPRARSSAWPPARRRWTSPTRSTRTSATAASARRSTARSCRCTTSCSSGDIVEVLTSKRERGPSRDWLAVVKTTRARNKIKQWFKQESRVDSEHTGRELLQEHLKKQGLPAQKITGSPLLADVIREMGFRKAEDFYIALGAREDQPEGRRQQGHAAPQGGRVGGRGADERRPAAAAPRAASPRDHLVEQRYGITVEGIDDVPLRLAKCCRPVSGDPIVGYVSLGRGITIHRDDCPNAVALRKDPERFVDVSWDGDNETSFKVELQVDGWDRHRLLEDLSRTFAEAGINILEARCIVSHPMVKNRFVVEVGDAATLKTVISRLRQIDAVFDAYRVTPTGG